MSSTVGAVERAPAAFNTISVGQQLSAALGWALVVLMPALALVLLMRRLGGEFDRPLGGWAIVAAAAALELTAWLSRRLVLSTKYEVLSAKPWIKSAIVSASAVLALASLTLPGTPTAAIAFAWLALIAGEVAQALFYFRPELWRQWITQPATISASISNLAAEEAEVPAGLIQQLTRVREGDRESLHALLRAEIPAGDRLAVLHLSFCPPLAGAPGLTANVVDGETAEVRVTQSEAFGARIEVRLAREDATPRSVLVEVLGTVTSRQGA